MQTKFKRHQKVRLLLDPDPEYVEYYSDKKKIGKGSVGKINLLLPNGQYHVEIIDEETGETIGYAPMPEEFLEAIEEKENKKEQ
ncbi:hypothetical protein D6817_01335 [Candidatus Pacearchaeota archaeon]|nr:MAG: hypothetical protein D6817_01335 [Candidatus Pacearchaeota archaeon]